MASNIQALANLLWRRSTQPGAAHRLGRGQMAILVLVLVLAQIVWPIGALAGTTTSSSPELVPLGTSELYGVTGGCTSNCDGGGDDGDESAAYAVGSPYWEYAYRTLLSRPSVPGNLVWHKINSTSRELGPFTVEYSHREKFDWSLGGSVPHWFVQGQIGGEREVTRTESMTFTIPPQMYYKLFVAYPYERWRYYFYRYQDYSDNSRSIVGSGDATVYNQWTKTNVVEGYVY